MWDSNGSSGSVWLFTGDAAPGCGLVRAACGCAEMGGDPSKAGAVGVGGCDSAW